jgi:hypothetical protein
MPHPMRFMDEPSRKHRGGGPSSVHSLRVQVGDLGQSYSDEANQDEVGEGSQGARDATHPASILWIRVLEPHTGFVGDLGESPIAIWDTASGQAGSGGVLTVFTTGAVFSASEANAEPSPAVIDEALRQIEMTVSERLEL